MRRFAVGLARLEHLRGPERPHRERESIVRRANTQDGKTNRHEAHGGISDEPAGKSSPSESQ